MATWVTHLIIADRVMNVFPELCRLEYCVGNIAPDCNVENEDWTSFTPSREITHWMSGKVKKATDCDRFLCEYINQKSISSAEEESFLLGYYSHLIADAEFQRFIRDEERVKAVWERIKTNTELKNISLGMTEDWDTAKRVINKEDRKNDVHSIEREYLDEHSDSGYFTEILPLKEFPDYIDYLPEGAIPRKVKVMGYMPKKQVGKYPHISISVEEYNFFLETAVDLVSAAIRKYKCK